MTDSAPISGKRRRGTHRVGALRKALARWRDFDTHRDRADYEEAGQAAREAMAFEDQAGVVVRPHLREAFR